jgi:hypothetical protein
MDHIILTVPLSDIFKDAYCFFYKMHGCTVEQTQEHLHNMRVYRFTFPEGTQWLFERSHCRTLMLPSGICIEVVPAFATESHSFLYVHIDPATINDVFMRDVRKEVQQ